ncbi:anti-sigma F factor-like protein [Paenibacillus larvae subsp. larvae B-3650]|nr:anti-sigma F factor-like protein [Paenibacillus larvae subsp. larvae B-3650]
MQFPSLSENEGFARVAVASFIAQKDPNIEELTEIKTVISEAVTNSIIHGYDNAPDGIITIEAEIMEDEVRITVEDEGTGIDDLELAKQPLFTSKPELERSGMGFTIMENFMDDVEVYSSVGRGTKIIMKKRIESKNATKAMYN